MKNLKVFNPVVDLFLIDNPYNFQEDGFHKFSNENYEFNQAINKFEELIFKVWKEIIHN